MPILVLATSNPGKVAELKVLLAYHMDIENLQVLMPHNFGIQSADIEETGETFEENALLKAREIAKRTGHIALADDSGLCVDALGGAPGVHSARWAGPDASDGDRITLLLARMEGIEHEQRTARFVCAAAVAAPDGSAHCFRGVCEGAIAREPRGENGFGYDPVFFIPALSRTMAELIPYDKNRLSHRASAVAKLAGPLWTFLGSSFV